MAVVTRYTKGYPDPTALSSYSSNAHEARANNKSSYFNIAVANGDSIASIYNFAKIPSFAMLLPHSTLYSNGIAGLASLSVGITDGLGTSLPAALMNAVDIHAAGSFSLVSAVAPANYGLRLWQLLNLASDPKRELTIFGTVNAAAAAAGIVNGHIYWSVAGP